MKTINFIRFIFFISILSLVSCTPSENLKIPEEVLGLKPVYIDTSKIENYIFSTGPKVLVEPGKIFKTNTMLFVSDAGTGIHVIDNSDNKNPQKIAFINIPGNADLAKKGNFLYADCNGYLITIDISDPLQAVVTGIDNMLNQDRIAPSAELRMKHFNSQQKVYYECPESNKGIVINWEVDTLYRPECYVGSSNSFMEE
ncbi:MAG: hypothetical protein ACKVQB_12300 [Bacteroidia bacterium]